MGPVQDVIGTYVRSATQRVTSPRGAAIDIIKAELLDERGEPTATVSPGAALTLRVTCHVNRSIMNYHLIFVLSRSTDGLKVFDGHLRSEDLRLDSLPPGETFTIDFRFRAHLARGQFHIGMYVWDNVSFSSISSLVPAGLFAVQETRTYGSGVADLELSCGGVARNVSAVG